MRRLFACLAATCCLFSLSNATALAGTPANTPAIASTWSIQSTPVAAGRAEPNVAVADTSCVSATECVAVGSSIDDVHVNAVGNLFESSTPPQFPLSAIWNGTSWLAPVAVPTPAGTQTANLTNVSCSSTTSCLALGQYTTFAGTTGTVVDSWNGTSWSIQASPPAAATWSSLSCGAPTLCIAVGYTGSLGAGTTVQATAIWNGSTWTSQPGVTPVGATVTQLVSVSCTTATACTAVGSYFIPDSGSSGDTLAEFWNGSTWALQTVPMPANVTSLQINSVSCASPTACMMVGTAFDLGADGPVVETWDGSSWTLGTAPTGGRNGPSMLDVSCSSLTACTAVGFTKTNTFKLLDWNGTAWSADHTIPLDHGSGFGASTGPVVSCGSATTCMAVEPLHLYGTGSFVEVRASGVWSQHDAPAPPRRPASYFTGVSCPSSTQCMAVGYYAANGGESTLAEQWNGSSWTILPTPNIAGTQIDYLLSISCADVTHCVAVGYSIVSLGGILSPEPIIENWDGTSWSIAPNPSPPATGLLSVSCASATTCVAVGEESELAVIFGWNGTAWSIETGAPLSLDRVSSSTLNSVSCATATSCEAVGSAVASSKNADRGLIEAWNGSTWTRQTGPGGQVKFTGISCPSVSACTAVGSQGTGDPAVASWNGSTWSAQRTPTPDDVIGRSFLNVSCASATSCVLGGSVITRNGDPGNLAEIWNGTSWTINRPLNPTILSANSITGISCSTSTQCVGVGTSISTNANSPASASTFAELYTG